MTCRRTSTQPHAATIWMINLVAMKAEDENHDSTTTRSNIAMMTSATNVYPIRRGPTIKVGMDKIAVRMIAMVMMPITCVATVVRTQEKGAVAAALQNMPTLASTDIPQAVVDQ